MKAPNVSLENLLDQLSEDKINLVVDNYELRAGGGCNHKSHSNNGKHKGWCKSKKSKSSKSHRSRKSGYVCW